MHHYTNAMRRYFEFSGRSSRSEYWLFYLFQTLIFIAATIADTILFGFRGEQLGPLYLIAAFGHFIPGLAVLVRRLHDADYSAWWLLLVFVPIVGWVALFVFLVTASTPGDNRFGPNPWGEPARGHHGQWNPHAQAYGGQQNADHGAPAHPAYAAPAAPAGDDQIEKLERLAAMKDSGAISEEEYSSMKRKILGASA